MRRSSVSPKNNKCVVTIINPLVDNNRRLECRICLESDGELLKVCSCSGSIEYVHLKCIKNWVERFPVNHENHIKCEICKQNYLLDLNSKNKIDKDSQDCRSLIFLLLGILCIIGILIIIIVLTNQP